MHRSRVAIKIKSQIEIVVNGTLLCLSFVQARFSSAICRSNICRVWIWCRIVCCQFYRDAVGNFNNMRYRRSNSRLQQRIEANNQNAIVSRTDTISQRNGQIPMRHFQFVLFPFYTYTDLHCTVRSQWMICFAFRHSFLCSCSVNRQLALPLLLSCTIPFMWIRCFLINFL